MPIPHQELEFRSCKSICGDGRRQREVIFFINEGLDRSGSLEVVVDVFHAGFVETYIGFSEAEEVGGEVGLAW
jgi:hypothetical protein